MIFYKLQILTEEVIIFDTIKYLILKSILAILGLVFMSLTIWSSYSFFKIYNKYNSDFLNNIFISSDKCLKTYIDQKINTFCLDINTANWLIMIFIVSSIFSFLTLFPFFLIKKKKYE